MASLDRPSSPPARNPKALSLKALFPTVDLAVIESVLEAHAGSEERAVESLLAMTDTDFVADARPAAADTADSDASYARALALEEEDQAADAAARYAARQQQRSAATAGEPAFDPTNLPYQARVRRAPNQHGGAGEGYASYQAQADYGQARDGGSYPQHQHQHQQAQGPGIEEQFQKLAVSGKKTFEGFMASGFVKNLQAKVANVQSGLGPQGQHHQQAYGAAGAPPDPAFSSSGRPSAPSRASSAASASAYSAYSAGAGRPQTQNPEFPASEWTVPGPPSRSNSTQAEIHINPGTPTAATGPTFSPSSSSPSFGRLGSPPASAGKRSDELLRSAQTGGRQSPSASLLGTSPTTTTAGGQFSTSPSTAKIDYAKLGLLPRQKISLDGRPPSPAAAAAEPQPGPDVPTSVVRKIEQQQQPARKANGLESDDDDDDLGYTRSPFDDRD